MDELLDTIRTEFRNVPLRELLHHKPRVLLGVTPEAETVLAALEVGTVFDLATSAVFDAATKLVQAGSDLASVLYQHGSPPADLVNEADAAGKQIDELQFLALDVLEAVPAAQVAAVKQALDAETVRDLALYPPYRAAVRLLTQLYFPESVPGFDPERPADLLPKTGEYPTERVQYSTLLMDAIEQGEGDPLVDVAGESFAPLDLAALVADDSGFKRIAFGALLTFNQSWYAQGVTLGQLLHSASLAPGESTRIAVVDWSRKSRAGETEVVDETEELTNDTTHNRSISEVTQAVADEAQGGFSDTNSSSRATQQATAVAVDTSSLLTSALGLPSASIGHTSSEATTDAHADSYSTSWGHRRIGTSMMQNVNDRTHQHAHSARSRRASVVKEVSQSEHADVSTRVLANYNHMHALTVQYYEVVQVYRVEVALAKADKVVFVPVALLDFGDDTLVRRFQQVLAGAALTYEISQALQKLDVIELAPEPTTRFTGLDNSLVGVMQAIRASSSSLLAIHASSKLSATAATGAATANAPNAPATDASSAAVKQAPRPAMVPFIQTVNDRLWSREQAARLSGLLGRAVLVAGSSAIQLPTDVSVDGASAEAGGAPMQIRFHCVGGEMRDDVDAASPLAMSEVMSIGVLGSSPERDVPVTVTLTLNRNGVRFPLQLPTVEVLKGNAGETGVVRVTPGGVSLNLKQHLNAHRLVYSQAVFRSLDSAQVALLLSGYGIEVDGKLVPVAQVVEPRPIRYVGNFLAFKMNSDAEGDKDWSRWLDEHGVELGATLEDTVPLPSGGVFAEAILGRSNCAEKLDITRFWNWQDSPIPLQPTDIAAIDTGSRATPEDVKPGQLSSPIVNITAPTSLPDPTGTAAILAAIQNGSMFRDMSGLQATIGLAQAALQASAAGASTAGQQAGTNMDDLLKANTERQRIAADLITSLAKMAASASAGVPVGGAGGGGASPGNHSQDGAKINYFDKTQGTPPAGGGSAGGSGAGAGGAAAAGHSGGGAAASGASGASSGPVGTDGYSHNPAALAATWGDSQSPSTALNHVLDALTGSLVGADAPPGAALAARRAWPKLDPNLVLPRIDALGKNANLFNQGAIGLCTAAAFYHHVIQHRPDLFSTCAITLYGSGIGFLGKLKIAPSSRLREADYAALAARFAGMPPQADWMLMAALRDSEDWLLTFEGAPDERFAMMTFAEEPSQWYSQTGLWSDVKFSEDTSLAGIQALTKSADNQIGLFIGIELLEPGRSGAHMLSLEGPITIDVANDKVRFDYWTWGQPVKTLETTLTSMKANYLGAITATF